MNWYVRRLTPDDAASLEAFLQEHRESSAFLHHNLLRGGLEYQGARYQAEYVGVFRDTALLGVASHSWLGTMLLQAPGREVLEQLEAAIPRHFTRPIAGLLGPREQCLELMERLSLDRSSAFLDQDEPLYRIDLDHLRVPAQLSAPDVGVRAPLPEELIMLSEWRMGYLEEVMLYAPTESLRMRAREDVHHATCEGRAFVLTRAGRPVAYCAITAITRDTAQLGGMWVPAPERGHRYGRTVSAGALLHARDQLKMSCACLLIDDGNRAALAGCEALAFARVGRFSFTLWDS